jgi:4-coumarate--CoA ligase
MAISFGKSLCTNWNWQEGDMIVWYSQNCVDTPALTHGTLWAQGVVSPANPAYSASELAFQLKDSGAKAIVTQVAGLETALKAAGMAGVPQDRILLIGDEKDPRAQHFSDFIESRRRGAEPHRIARASSDLAFLVYSSGTTGLPKGVRLTHRNLISNLLMIRSGQAGLNGDGEHDHEKGAIMAVLPFYHIYGSRFCRSSAIPLSRRINHADNAFIRSPNTTQPTSSYRYEDSCSSIL